MTTYAEAQFSVDRWPGLITAKVIAAGPADQVARSLTVGAVRMAAGGRVRLRWLRVGGVTRFPD